MLQVLRCFSCKKKLCEYNGIIVIKCNRCKKLNRSSAQSAGENPATAVGVKLEPSIPKRNFS